MKKYFKLLSLCKKLLDSCVPVQQFRLAASLLRSCESRNLLQFKKTWAAAFSAMVFLFEFSAFAIVEYDRECRRIRNGLGANCNSLEVRYDWNRNEIECICDGTPLNSNTPSTCPTGAVLKDKLSSIVSRQGTISCGNLPYADRDLDDSYSDWLRASRPIYLSSNTQRNEPLRMCWVEVHVAKEHLTIRHPNRCLIDNRPDPAPLQLVATCPHNTNADRECKNILRDMIAGRVTFQPDEALRGSCCSGRLDSSCITNQYITTASPQTTDGGRPKHLCSKELYNRTSNSFTGKSINIFASYNGTQIGKGGYPNVQGPINDMQCLSDNIKTREICECPATPPQRPYTFEPGEDSSCYCSDGVTLKTDKEGSNCPSPTVCPTTDSNFESVDGGNCRCKCSNDNSISFLIPSGTASCPVVDSTTKTFTVPAGTLSGGFITTGNECKSEKPTCDIFMDSHTASDDLHHTPGQTDKHHRSSNPSVHKHNHPYVTKIGTDTITESSNERCADGNPPKKDTGDNKYYCYRGQNVETSENTETRACTDSTTQGTNHGTCTATVTGGTNSKCLTFSEEDDDVESSDPVGGSCSSPSVGPYNVSTVRGLCINEHDLMGMNPDPRWDNRCRGRGRSQDISVPPGSSNSKCICVDPDPSTTTTEYTCPSGTPSSQTDSCECREPSQNIKTCDPNPDGKWVLQEDSSLGTCDCPTGWTRDNSGTPGNDSDDKCTKAASGSSVSRGFTAYYNSNLNALNERPLVSCPGHRVMPCPQNLSGAQSDSSWTCATQPDMHFVRTNNMMVYVCTKTTSQKQCTEGGQYDSGLDKCVQPCTQNSVTNSCECVKTSETTTATCPPGWTAHTLNGVAKCRQEAATQPGTTVDQCQCKCFVPEGAAGKDFPFYVGDDTYNEIKGNYKQCIDYDSNNRCVPNPLECCHQGHYYPQCPAAIPSPDGICPTYCPDGNPIPSDPGGCCPTGKAVSDLKNCPSINRLDGDPPGIDMAFSSNDFSSVLSVYSVSSMDRPDFICWEMKEENNKTMKIQRRDAFCPPRRECEGSVCQCRTWDVNKKPVLQEKTYCEYASSDPMRYEEGVIRGDLPSAGERQGDDNNLRFFKNTTIVTP